jgi:hypothetical protein
MARVKTKGLRPGVKIGLYGKDGAIELMGTARNPYLLTRSREANGSWSGFISGAESIRAFARAILREAPARKRGKP